MAFPSFQQLDYTDCGPTCLKIIMKYYGKEVNTERLRELTYKRKTGVSLLGLSDAADKLGFRSCGHHLSYDELQHITLPCIAHWNGDHFVVIYKIKNNEVHISDPARGLIKYQKDEFLSFWSQALENSDRLGYVLSLIPTGGFDDLNFGQPRKLNFSFLFGYIKPYRKLIFQLFLSFIITTILSLIFPFLTQSMVDVGIGTGNKRFVILILVAQIFLTIGQTASNFIRGWIMLYFGSRVSLTLVTDFLIKLMKLQIPFFTKRLIGDITQRITDNVRIQRFLTGSLVNMIFGILNFLVYSSILAYYFWQILLAFYLGSLVYFLWIVLFFSYRKKTDNAMFDLQAANQSSLYELVTAMPDIKLNNAEKPKRWDWERIQARLFNLQITSMKINQLQSGGSVFINQIKNIFISYLTVMAVIDGQLTLGMMMSIQYILGQLNGPVNEFIGFSQSTQDAKISLERLDEVYSLDDENESRELYNIGLDRMSEITLHRLDFHYEGPRSPKILDDINLTIPMNKTTAIVGASGSGKSSLLKLLMGSIIPTSGTIYLGRTDLAQCDLTTWRENFGAVTPESYLFSDTIVGNITMTDGAPDYEKLELAVKISNLEDYIDSQPKKYHTKIGSGGVGLSNGQKQRLLIARAVYRDPKFLFLDEATSALDANNEKKIIENLEFHFKKRTVVTVAHRLSTIKSADQIVVLHQGRIVEIGTHMELYTNKKHYYELVKNQV